MSYSSTELWFMILGLGVGTFFLRFSFLGLIGDRPLPLFFQRMLRYTAVAVLPGIVAPLVLWPAATGGEMDPGRVLAALVTGLVAWRFRNMLLSILSGAATLFVLHYAFG